MNHAQVTTAPMVERSLPALGIWSCLLCPTSGANGLIGWGRHYRQEHS